MQEKLVGFETDIEDIFRRTGGRINPEQTFEPYTRMSEVQVA